MNLYIEIPLFFIKFGISANFLVIFFSNYLILTGTMPHVSTGNVCGQICFSILIAIFQPV